MEFYAGAVTAIVLAVLGWGFWIERRLSRVEVKIDLVLKHNGVEETRGGSRGKR